MHTLHVLLLFPTVLALLAGVGFACSPAYTESPPYFLAPVRPAIVAPVTDAGGAG